MGSLITAAVPRLRSPEEANLRAPEAVVSLHLSFINAGAEVIETNTFGANRRKLATNFLEDELEQINSLGVKLARDARERSGRDVFIAGAIGPIGEAMTSARRHELFAEQAAVLEGRGADLFMLETFYDLDELVDAITRAARSCRSCRSSRCSPSTRAPRRSPASARARRPNGSPSSISRPSARTTAPGCSPRSRRSSRCRATAARSRRCRTSASPASRAAASSTRTRRRTTSPSSPRTRATWARG